MKYIIESVISGTNKHYAYYSGYCENGTAHHKWANNKKQAEIYTNGCDLFDALGRLFKDYSGLKFIIIKRK